MIHQVNIGIHVVAGTAALVIGLITLISNRHADRHKRFGRYFLYLLSGVVTTGFLGWLFFRSNSFLLMLTLLSGYVGYAGLRVIRLREKKASAADAWIAILGLSLGLFYLVWLQQGEDNWSPTVVYPTLFALALVTVYDLIKYFWLHNQIKGWWLYEHIYKMISAFSAILSAFVGTLLPNFKPYSQVGPSVFCVFLMVFFMVQRASQKRKHLLNLS